MRVSALASSGGVGKNLDGWLFNSDMRAPLSNCMGYICRLLFVLVDSIGTVIT